MKVWELIRELHDKPAMADVFVSSPNCLQSFEPTYIEVIDNDEPMSGLYLRTRKEPI
jgi:hypothetical protein